MLSIFFLYKYLSFYANMSANTILKSFKKNRLLNNRLNSMKLKLEISNVKAGLKNAFFQKKVFIVSFQLIQNT